MLHLPKGGPKGRPQTGSGGDGKDGGGIEGRLRDLEVQVARVETKLAHVATREDIADLKTIIAEKETTSTRWLIGIIVSAVVALLAAMAAVAAALIRTFMG